MEDEEYSRTCGNCGKACLIKDWVNDTGDGWFVCGEKAHEELGNSSDFDEVTGWIYDNLIKGSTCGCEEFEESEWI